MKTGYYSNREMRYGTEFETGRLVERGEIIKLVGAPNDQVMIGTNHIVDIAVAHPEGIDPHECVRCGKKFADSSYKAGHDRGSNPCATEARGEPMVVSSGVSGPVDMPGESTEEV